MTRREKILDKIVRVIKADAPDSEVFLYGSRARGDSTAFSDWDVLILINSKEVSFELETQIMDNLYDVEIETGEVITPLIYSKNDWLEKHAITPLYDNIQKESIRLS